jgi:hypothetical protein
MCMSLESLMVKRHVPFELYEIDILAAGDEELKELSSELGLNLSLDELKTIQRYFATKMWNFSP